MDSSEVRVTNPKTGGQKGQKLARYDLIPPRAIEALAEHYGRGAQKYADRNWERGVDWSLSFAAMQRHVWAWWNGEETDEDGNSHLAAAMWHVAALIEYGGTHPELDDRPNSIDSSLSDEDLEWAVKYRGDCPPNMAYLLNTSHWMLPQSDPELDAEDKFDEDFLAYLDWRDGVDEPGGPRYLAWRDTR